MLRILPTLLLAFLPVVASAQAPSNFADLVSIFLRIINGTLIPAVFALAFLVIIWGIVKAWIISAGDENEREKGRQLVLAGIIGLVIMGSIWGILGLLQAGLFGF